MFQLYLCFELLFMQIISFHYTPTLLHILKLMMNAIMTLHLMVEYSTCLIFLLFSTPLLLLFFSTPFLLLFFSTISLPPLTFICAHISTLPFPLLFFVVFQWHCLHSCCCELQNLKNTHNFNNKRKLLSIVIVFFLSLNILPITFIFLHARHLSVNV